MINISISDEEFDNYLKCFDKKKNEKSKILLNFNKQLENGNNFIRYEEINPEINYQYEENNNINFVNYYFNSLKNKNNKDNFVSNNEEIIKKKGRTSKFKINEILNKYFEKDKKI